VSGALLTVRVYDVADNTRRRKVHALLKQYGVAMQESAFEGRLTVNERARVVARVGRLLDLKADRFVMYTVPKDHEARVEELGIPRPKVEENGFWIV
jgi:CRISPR-associated endonuclease Cas2